MELAPSIIRFLPLYQERVWGGRNLETLFGRTLPRADVVYGESWEVCDRTDSQSIVRDGLWAGWTLHDLWTKARNEVFGAAWTTHPAPRFPLLLKILDATDDLSLQVHPDDASASSVGGEAKSEAWYVVQAEPKARLFVGFKSVPVKKEDVAGWIENGSLAEHTAQMEVRAHDVIGIPGGMLHAIGRGTVIFEIQQNSDTTFRVFDWNRAGLDGRPRALHQAEALAVLDLETPAPEPARAVGSSLIDWPFFRMDRWNTSLFEARSVPADGQFWIGAVVEGSIQWEGEDWEAKVGDFFIIPASLPEGRRQCRTLTPSAKILWIRFPDGKR